VMDASGNLFGTTFYGGSSSGCSFGCGSVYELSPGSSGWTEKVLYSFTGGNDGSAPESALILDGQGDLFGTAGAGGNTGCIGVPGGCGTVFELQFNRGNFTFVSLYDFNGTDGWKPGGLVLDSQGNLYGMTNLGGTGWGNVYELSPGTKGQWSESDIYDFTNGDDGGQPAPTASMIFDNAGKLYGTTFTGGKKGVGVLFTIVP
jgi:uncharacterized repeat protein (TIGR03803 family)